MHSDFRFSTVATSRHRCPIYLYPFALFVLMYGCQVANSQFAPTGHMSSIVSRNDSNCGFRPERLAKNSGKLLIPAVPSTGSYAGTIGYAGHSGGKPNGSFMSCVYDFDNIPVPEGYFYDWFGQLELDVSPGSVTFEPGSVKGELYSNQWVAKRRYYLFLYTQDGQLIESYLIARGAVKMDILKFDSPFENGLVYAGPIELEIAHRSKSD